MRKHLKDKPFGPGANVAALDVFEFSFSTLENLSQKILGHSAGKWGAFHPHGFLIDQVNDFRRENGVWILENPWGESVELHGRLYLPGENTPGPWLAICLVTSLPGDAGPKIYRAYVHPIENIDSWFLVDSDLERKTLGLLRKSQWAMAKAGKPYDIIKPLLDMKPKRGNDLEPVRPDFIIERKDSRRLVVETMGYQSDDYRVRKSRTHPRMKNLENVIKLIEHSPPDDGGFLAQFKSFVG